LVRIPKFEPFQGPIILNEKRFCDTSRTAKSSDSNSPCAGSNPPAPASQCRVRSTFQRHSRMGRKYGLFTYRHQSLGACRADTAPEIVESLRPIPRIFPFSGDCWKRPASIGTPPVGRTRLDVTDKLSNKAGQRDTPGPSAQQPTTTVNTTSDRLPRSSRDLLNIVHEIEARGRHSSR
jgi:hypothetical protein